MCVRRLGIHPGLEALGAVRRHLLSPASLRMPSRPACPEESVPAHLLRFAAMPGQPAPCTRPAADTRRSAVGFVVYTCLFLPWMLLYLIGGCAQNEMLGRLCRTACTSPAEAAAGTSCCSLVFPSVGRHLLLHAQYHQQEMPCTMHSWSTFRA